MSDSAIKKFLNFTGKTAGKIANTVINYPRRWIYIGKIPEIVYISDKWDGKVRAYKHEFKKYGIGLVSPNGKLILIIGLNLNIKAEGLTG